MAFDATARTAELEELYLSDEGGWRAIKAIADPLNIEKPETGWDDAIPLIVEAEKAADSTPPSPPEDSSDSEESAQEASPNSAPNKPPAVNPADTPWRKVRTDLYGNVIPNLWSS